MMVVANRSQEKLEGTDSESSYHHLASFELAAGEFTEDVNKVRTTNPRL